MFIVDLIAKILVIVGAINWGLAVFKINLVTLLVGPVPFLANIVYLAIAASGIYLIKDILTMRKKR